MRQQPLSLCSLLALALLLVSLPSLVWAQDDYRLDNTSWNGLSRFAALLKEANVNYEVEQDLSWGEVEPTDILFFLYPQRQSGAAPMAGPLSEFLARGGRAILADDFGSSSESIAQLGITRSTALPPELAAYADNPALPFAAPVGGHRLTENVGLLLTNHPAVFFSELTPVFVLGKPIESREPSSLLPGVVVEGGREDGRLIAISDPSIFINAMIAYPGNTQFAKNLIADMVGEASGGKKLRIFVGAFSERGRLEDEAEEERNELVSELQKRLEEFNQWLDSFSEYSPQRELVRPLTLLLLFPTLLALFVRMLQSAPRYDGHWLGGQDERAAGPLQIGPPRAPLHAEEAWVASLLAGEIESFVTQLQGEAKGLATEASKIVWLLRQGKPGALPDLSLRWQKALQAHRMRERWLRRGRREQRG